METRRSSERRAFVERVIVDTTDDAIRLIFADWLAENGEEPYSEFVRVQCELAACERLEIDLHNEDTDWSECTGIAGSWCPNCGDCCCRCREDSMSDEDCPLHGSGSRHCCLDALHDRTGALHCRERDLLDVYWSKWVHAAFDQLAHDVGVATDGHTTRFKVVLYDGFASPTNSLECEFRRGFIAAITCTLAGWCGEMCSRCGGGRWTGRNLNIPGASVCPVCHGTGRVGGHGPQLVACCPLEKVTLLNKSPLKSDGKKSSFRWTWRPAEEAASEFWQLPRELFLLLPTGANSGCILIRDAQENWTSRLSVRDYDTEAAAQEALSVACLAWAKLPEKVGVIA